GADARRGEACFPQQVYIPPKRAKTRFTWLSRPDPTGVLMLLVMVDLALYWRNWRRERTAASRPPSSR
ncbi:MAG: hypothetical protein IJG13_11355, partial [Kiritimatiellae bacterium]|nr:hypothetical protein [Kiritimatiellia bacterium]